MAFPNFNVAAFSACPEQIPELQVNLLTTYAQWAEGQGYDLEGVIIETQRQNFRLRKLDGRWTLQPA